jgi:multidrug transporter EmrE-like cation transporter
MLETDLVGVFYFVCFGFLTLIIEGIRISVVYGIWSGLGTIIAVALGTYFSMNR